MVQLMVKVGLPYDTFSDYKGKSLKARPHFKKYKTIFKDTLFCQKKFISSKTEAK